MSPLNSNHIQITKVYKINLIEIKMKTRNFDIANLQPTEMPRESSQSYLEGLRLEEIKLKHGPLQVWEIDKILCIADGNQRTINAEKKRRNENRSNTFP